MNESKLKFQSELLKQDALELARRHTHAESSDNVRPVQPQLRESADVLSDAFEKLTTAVKKNKEVSPAAEWLIDNFYVVQEQIVQVENDFPIQYQRNLPHLTSGPHSGMPRVYDLAWNVAYHTDNVVDVDMLTKYTEAYQEEHTLKTGELWALPIMVRLALIQQLSQKAERVLKRWNVRQEARELVDDLLEQDTGEPASVLRHVIEWMDGRTDAYDERLLYVELVFQLQNAGLISREEKNWFEYRFNAFDTTLDEALRDDAQRQSKLQVSIQNAIVSLRNVTETEWVKFVEACSTVDQILLNDPMDAFSEMDSNTRSRYRSTVERLSRNSGHSEPQVAEEVLSLAREHTESAGDEPGDLLENDSFVKQHVGYYLVGEGYETLTEKIGYHMPVGERIRRRLETTAGYYIGSIGLFTLIFLAVLWAATDAVHAPLYLSITTLLVGFFPALELAISVMNRFFVYALPPRELPRMKYEDDLPDDARTMVVVPTLFTSPEDVERQVEKLQIRALANPDPNVQFVLLSDFTDADQETKPGDEEILEKAKQLIDELNETHTSRYGDKFFVLHRKREWNPSEEAWMGWERKRGKLETLNRWLCNPSESAPFPHVFGDFAETIRTQPVQFVLTLDSDTRTPPESIIDLVRVASHPLNRPRYDREKGRVTKGYSIIQPRISIPPDSANETLFARIFSGNVGIDPYTTAVSDIYQDLTGEAIFTGKGIYDVRAFHTVLHEQFPENRILSHDLIESNYLRAGLVTDIELFDDYPSNYASYCSRLHRWTRGDWQIASWILPEVPDPGGLTRNPTNLLSRWKIFDNLRRSLTPFFLTLFFLAGWSFLPGSALIWTLAAFGILAFPIYVNFSSDVMSRPARVEWTLYFEKVRSNLKINTFQALSTLAILPHQAVLQLDAVVRTLWRLLYSKKRLLEWTSASRVERFSSNDLNAYLRSMSVSVFLGIGVLGTALLVRPFDLWIVAPFSLLWITSPFIGWYLSTTPLEEKKELEAEETRQLRLYARRTWFYFEQHMNEKHSWLPPDNDQVDPSLPPAARTSPTNIGLALVSIQTAYELGYLPISELLNRLEQTLSSLTELERYNGHFFNWYEIHHGDVLDPKYISTVDSGNLAAGLIVIKQAVGRLLENEDPIPDFVRGLQDTVEVLGSIMDDLDGDIDEFKPLVSRIKNHLDCMSARLDTGSPTTVSDGLALLNDLSEPARQLSEEPVLQLRGLLGDEQAGDLEDWLERPLHQIEHFRSELNRLDDSPNPLLRTSPADRRNALEENGTVNGEGKASERALLDRWKHQIQTIQDTCDRLVSDMDFSFLYNEERGVFSIGYNVEKAEEDQGFYDLLASEARLASFIAIAKGDVPTKHWFRLSRRLTSRNGQEFLLSWGGTTFEYLMPHLFLTSYPNTLLQHTFERIVEWQQDYAEKSQRPWGFSESAYKSLNRELQYQYRSFGVPGLGLKRGLAEDYVVAPYASMLSLMVEPEAAIDNLNELDRLGGMGLKGFYDAVDFTPDHVSRSKPYEVVKTFMAHHHGMSLLAMLNVLKGDAIQSYFHSDPRIKGCELLLQERIPRGALVKDPYPSDVEMEPGEQQSTSISVHHAGMQDLDNTPPRVHLLSNGHFHSVISLAGTGCSRYEKIQLTGWTPDATTDPDGQFMYVRDCETNQYWSAFHQPVKRKPERFDMWFHNGKVQSSRVDESIETSTEVCVSPEDPIELRTITLTNHSDRVRTLEVTTYADVVLNRAEEHRSHPAFSKLFIQTGSLDDHPGLIAWRRPRSDDEASRWMFHNLVSHDPDQVVDSLQYETERAHFVGRGRSRMNPRAMDPGETLSGTEGNVSDPILSLRRKITLDAGEKVRFTVGTGHAESREQAENLVEMYDNLHAVERTFELSTIYNTVELEHIGLRGSRFQYFQRLAGYILYTDSGLRADESVLRRNRRQQSDLWSYDISGDHPVVVFRINRTEQMDSLKTLLRGHLLWKHRGLTTDLVILNDHPPSYADELQEDIQQTVESIHSDHREHGEGEVFVLRTDRMSDEDVTLLLTVASMVMSGSLPDLDSFGEKDHTASFAGDDTLEYTQAPSREQTNEGELVNEEDLLFFNGYGGFSKETGEYRIQVRNEPGPRPVELPPAPWSNVIANSSFGFLATERGAGYTWSENSRENKLTEWSNDPVRDPLSEAFYIRDEHHQTYWSPAPGPVPGQNGYVVTHGFGHTTYEHESFGIESELIQFVPEQDPVKVSTIKLRNNGDEPRHLTLFSYREWVLGVNREEDARYIIQEASPEGAALFAYNHYNNEFADRVAFAAGTVSSLQPTEGSFFTDRNVFIGRNRSLKRPRAVTDQTTPENEVRTGGEPCAAFQREITLEPGEEQTWIVLMGQTSDRKEAEDLIEEYQSRERVEKELQTVSDAWDDRLNRVHVDTPDASLNQMMNGWLMYQNMACRMWSRTGFYQAGGAYGFRDQLQDAMTAFYSEPDMTREQILLHASRQFPEGDVQHWWHPPTGRGVRTNISDDKLWLPYVVHFYIESTGNRDILNEEVAYLEARSLEENEHEAYLHPRTSSRTDTLYEHCARAIDDALETGEHGLPLIGTGDWNDGMNRVGHKGSGESVWLGFFLYDILNKFIPFSKEMSDPERAERYEKETRLLAGRLNEEGWDGKWFLRAFYDDGTPLGSAQNDDCQIDAISQSWSIISNAADPEKKRLALKALEEHLISREDQLIRLLTPPFDQSDQDPGYIKGYIPGVRENGGQYTHAATWAIKAFAESGHGNKAVEYLHMINPINHVLDREQVSEYRVEPYAVAADVYGEPPLVGRGGWTWYTGSAGWMYRVALESILGIRVRGDTLVIQPAISSDWDSYCVDWTLRDGETVYEVEVSNPSGLQTGALEGTVDDNPVHFPEGPAKINLENDQQRHVVDLRLISKDEDLQ